MTEKVTRPSGKDPTPPDSTVDKWEELQEKLRPALDDFLMQSAFSILSKSIERVATEYRVEDD